MSEQMNLHQKIWAVTSEVGKVKESLSVATKVDKNGKAIRSYKAVSINDVVDSLIPLLSKYRLVVLPVKKEIIKDEQIVTSSNYGDRTQFWVRMHCTYMVVDIDDPKSFVMADGYGDGFDSGDKACGKAETYARKYALISVFNISRGEDPDEEKSLEYKPKTASLAEIEKAVSLYTPEEMDIMLRKMKVNSIDQLSEEQVRKMIAYREKVSVTDREQTF